MRAFLLLLGLAVATPACGSSEESTEATQDELQVGGVAGAILHDMRVRHPGEEGRTWTVTKGNALPVDALLQVPLASFWGTASLRAPKACAASGTCEADFQLATCASDRECGGGSCRALAATKKSDGDAAKRVCAGHSDAILDDIYGVMTSAHRSLDVTSLTPPSGRYLATFRNALTTLDRRGEAVVVRFLFGEFPRSEVDVQGVMRDLTRDLGQGTRLTVSVGAHRAGLTTWNHSKIIAADGVNAIVGGMNLWGDHYLDANPVHDVSLHVKGPVVATMQSFANELWKVPCSDASNVLTFRRGATCPPAFVAPPAVAAGNVQMMGLGRLGTSRDATKHALMLAMRTATRKIRISQQDIGSIKLPGGVLVDDYMDAWVHAARHNVDVEIVLSNDNSFGGTGTSDADSYSNGWSPEELYRGVLGRARELGFEDAPQKLCEHLHFYRLRASNAATWADGTPLANHAKVVVIDDDAYYVGSQNLYDANLAEYGVLVDDPAATRSFIASYFDKVMQFSKPTLHRDASCR